MTEPTPFNQSAAEYLERVNRVMDYIGVHLDRTFSLEELAALACFSPYHFHRIFHAVSGETLNSFILRLRVERAATLLRLDGRLSATAIALRCGFADSAHFCRAFKQRFGLPPTQYRKIIQATPPAEEYACVTSLRAGPYLARETPAVRYRSGGSFVYLRYQGAYAGNGRLFHTLWRQLQDWSGERGYADPRGNGLVIYHDSPDITAEPRLRMSLCLPALAGAQPEGRFGLLKIAPGAYLETGFLLSSGEYGRAWQEVYGYWLPNCGCLPDDRPAFEEYPAGDSAAGSTAGDSTSGKSGRYPVRICVPVSVP